jgi:hypothetical protein
MEQGFEADQVSPRFPENAPAARFRLSALKLMFNRAASRLAKDPMLWGPLARGESSFQIVVAHVRTTPLRRSTSWSGLRITPTHLVGSDAGNWQSSGDDAPKSGGAVYVEVPTR